MELKELCKARHGLGEKRKADPLDAKHVPPPGARSNPVSLASLTHHAGVNALAQDQTVEFGPSLTVVYGANAAGKSGYTRILKRACRARGAEDILGNVVSGGAPGRPSARIKFTVDGNAQEFLWDDDKHPNTFLSRVSVFDRHCASVYIAEQTDVAFRPLGLDLFDKLSDACEAVRDALEKERKALEAMTLQIPEVADGTKVHELISHLTSLTNPEEVRNAASLSDKDKVRIDDLRNRLHDLRSDDPQKTAKALELRAKRFELLGSKIEALSEVLSDAPITRVFSARDRMTESQRTAEEMRRATFESQPLPHTGSDTWRILWAAAERFSITQAYPNQPFPVTGGDSHCLLCQQQLGDEGAQRLRQFQKFLSSAVQRERDEATARYQPLQKQLHGLAIIDEPITEALEELQLEDSGLGGAAKASLDAAEARRRAVTKALADGSACPSALPASPLDPQVLNAKVANLRDRANDLRNASDREAIAKIHQELRELDARQVLADHLAAALEEIERKKRLAAFQLCLDETKTTAITRKSSEVTKTAVTEQLTKRFKEELAALEFRHIEIQMVAAGGSRGALYHKLELKRAPGVSVPKVVSDGEARCLSIASFFAELSTAADQSAILFDDPVSSLDHLWRGRIAERLVVESKSRQVVVFTHDIVFLLALSEHAEKLGVDLKHQYLRRDNINAGLSSQRLCWAAMKVKDRLGYLRELWQSADKLHRDGQQQEYERNASYIYGLLREAWERAVEEVLLAGIVERYRNSIQTQQARHLADICERDCKDLDAGMTRCSKWLTGHDQAAAENAPFPEPSELQGDIKALDDWVQEIRKRRQK